MTNDNKPPMFPRVRARAPRAALGESALMNAMVADLTDQPTTLAETVIGKCMAVLRGDRSR
ncbi:hypothetical protein ACUDCK_29700 (plasmid) [Achromobacter sp. CF-sbj1-Ac2-l]|uniref:hypothetical protein n=1 Tax=Achromobacter sp. CF-sbj1-Ac2-l TaxID=3444091 RepID=UPI004046CDCD